MTLAQFAIAAGAEAKWVQNAAALLDLELTYSEDEARLFGLLKSLHEHLGVSLEFAHRLATEILAAEDSPTNAYTSPDGVVSIWVDCNRYESDLSVALTRALHHYEPQRRGRPPDLSGLSATERARRYGIDISLLEASLRLTTAERLTRLDRNLEFLKALRRGTGAR